MGIPFGQRSFQFVVMPRLNIGIHPERSTLFKRPAMPCGVKPGNDDIDGAL